LLSIKNNNRAIHYVIISFSVGTKKVIIQIDFKNKNINTYQRSIHAKEKSFLKIFIEILNKTLPRGSTIIVSLD